MSTRFDYSHLSDADIKKTITEKERRLSALTSMSSESWLNKAGLTTCFFIAVLGWPLPLFVLWERWSHAEVIVLLCVLAPAMYVTLKRDHESKWLKVELNWLYRENYWRGMLRTEQERFDSTFRIRLASRAEWLVWVAPPEADGFDAYTCRVAGLRANQHTFLSQQPRIAEAGRSASDRTFSFRDAILFGRVP